MSKGVSKTNGRGGARPGSGRKPLTAEERRPVAFRIPESTALKLKRLADEAGVSQVKMITDLIERASSV